ncbi:MAG: 16S rRNA (guanine(527)-N(7))-methyltransferase RsmG [bacterium]|nr:16S rRNA (guanine(527)-N(7))-methyltransferase RsmG [bacterium]
MQKDGLQELLKQGAEGLEINFNDPQIRLFFVYLDTLKSYNQQVHLTGIKTSKEIIIKHFLDSLTCFCGFNPDKGMKIIDLGTGAGFPGIPLKICHPGIELTLLDSNEKQVDFLYHLKNQLSIEFEILIGRAEDLGKKVEYRERYDVVVARAVAKLNTLVECALPFLKAGGIFIAQKGFDIQNEVSHAQKAIEVLGGRIREQKRIILPILHEERNLVIIEKLKSSPLEYPRRPGIPQRKPLK